MKKTEQKGKGKEEAAKVEAAVAQIEAGSIVTLDHFGPKTFLVMQISKDEAIIQRAKRAKRFVPEAYAAMYKVSFAELKAFVGKPARERKPRTPKEPKERKPRSMAEAKGRVPGKGPAAKVEGYARLTLEEVKADPGTWKKPIVEFARLANALSPENVSRDGELNASAILKARRKLQAEWKRLEKSVKRTVSEGEAVSFYSEVYGE